MTSYGNPRMEAVVNDWPSGGKQVAAYFKIETHPTRVHGPTRQTTGAVRTMTYCEQARIVDGDDGRIYFAELYRNMITVRGGNLMNAGTFHSDDPRYPELHALFDVAA